MKKAAGGGIPQETLHIDMEEYYNIINGNLTVNEVAQSVGYDDYFTFAKRFKRETGSTPTEFREKLFY